MQFLLALLLAAASPTPAGQLRFTFIGNEAFHVTDGTTTLVSDFPYRSGAFGYMTYEPAAVPPATGGILLISHAHADHFAPELYQGPLLSMKIVAPPAVAPALPGAQAPEPGRPARFGEIEILAYATPHGTPQGGGIAHYSYLVTWRGRKVYFTGDTESNENLLAMRGLDVAFVTPWLLAGLAESGKRIDARKVVVYHHRADQKAPPYPGVVLPRQRETFSIPWSGGGR
jgi:L-ascorbate metabolism protein UlaG (beta-lactamase superfamily)